MGLLALPQKTPSSKWWIVALIGLGYSGYFKGSPLLASMPGDLTFALALIVAAAVAIQALLGSRGDLTAATQVVVAFVMLVPAVAFAVSAPKTITLFTVTLTCALAPCFLLLREQTHRWWLTATVIGATVMAGAAIFFPDPNAQAIYGRLSLDGGNTIGTSRVIAAGVVVTGTLALTASRHRTLLVLASLGGIAATLAVGSRGPLIGIAIAIAAVLIFSKLLTGKRATAIGISVIGATVATWLATKFQTGGGARVAAFLDGENGDEGRSWLAGEALARIPLHPFGLGWGGFGSLGFTSGSTRLTYPHNMVLEVAVEGGWLALATLIILAFLSLQGYVRSATSATSTALFGLGVYWITVAQTSSDINGNRMTWIALSLGLVMRSANGAAVENTESARRVPGHSSRPDPDPASTSRR